MIYNYNTINAAEPQIRSALAALESFDTLASSFTSTAANALRRCLDSLETYNRWGDVRYIDWAGIHKFPSGTWGYYKVPVPCDVEYLQFWFSTGAFMFGDGYDTELFDRFFEEMKPGSLHVDEINHKLLFDEAHGKAAVKRYGDLMKKYRAEHAERAKERRKEKLKRELEELENGTKH